MRWVRLRRSKVKVSGEKLKLMMRGMTAQEEHTHFLHGLLTNDIRSLRPGTFNYNLWLRPNGQPVGDMFVYRFRDHFLIDTELPADRVIEEFTKLKLSLKVKFEDVSEDMDHIFLFGEGSGEFVKDLIGGDLRNGEFRETEFGIVARNDVRIREEGYDIIGDLSGIDLPEEGKLTEREFEDIRIERCVPRTGKELREGFSPLEAGLLETAISMTKGCYVGQEAVARVYYRGRTPRTLVRFKGRGKIKEGEEVLKGDKKVGLVTSVRSDGKLGIGYILRSAMDGTLKTQDGTELEVLPCDGQS